MSGPATITIEGNVGRDPERKQIGNNCVSEFSVAVTNKHKGENVTTWFRCSDWEGVTEDVPVTKGKRVKVTGRFFARPYRNQGVDRLSLEVSVEAIEEVKWKGEQIPAPAPAVAAEEDLPF